LATFKEFGLQPAILDAVGNMGFEETTPIQEKTIPYGLQGKDLIAQAQTGTGKTAAFGIPIIQRLETDASDIQALVLTPTRELAVQVAEELNRIGQFKKIRALPIYGGQDIGRQIKSLKKHPNIIVATPGRLMDHMRRRTIRLQSLEAVVLDEADEMLNMGFIEDIENILAETPSERQTLLFSATMPIPIQRLAKKFMRDPQVFSVKAKEMTVPNITQQYMEVQEKKKFDVLCRLFDVQSPKSAIVFGRTKRRVDELGEALNKRGYAAEGIHGDLNQAKRDSVLGKFRRGAIDFLIATDVAARGLDISGVTHVYNFDIPQDAEGYVHRIGRTGRAGKEGLALTFVTPREIDHLHTIEALTKRKMERKPVPSIGDAIEGQQRLAVDGLLEVVQQGNLQGFKVLAEELLGEHDSAILVAAALKMLTKETIKEDAIKLTAEPPLRAKKSNNQRYSKGRPQNKGGKNWGKPGGGKGKGRSNRSSSNKWK